MGSKGRGQETGFGRKLVYGLSHLLCGIAVVVVLLSLIQCTIKKPEAPSWRTNLVIPLANKAWDMPGLIDRLNQENLSTDSLGNPLFFYHSDLGTFAVAGSFAIPGSSQTIAESLGVIDLEPFAEAQTSVDLADYVALQAGEVPPGSFDISLPLPPMEDFTTATIQSGLEQVTIVNNFGLALDTVVVQVNDLGRGTPIAGYIIPGGLAAGGVAVDTIDLSGRTISNQFGLVLHCHTPGATAFSLAEKTLNSAIEMPAGLKVISATAKIPGLTKSFVQTIPLTSIHQIQTATLDRGRLVLDVQNSSDLTSDMNVTLSEVLRDGQPFVITQLIAAHQTGHFDYDLSGYSLVPSSQIMPQSLPVAVDVVIDSTAPLQVIISASDKFSIIASLQDVGLRRVEGILGETTVDFDDIQRTIDRPIGFDDVQLPAASAVLAVRNTVNIPGAMTITLDGDQGQHRVITGAITPGTPETPMTSLIVADDLASFLHPIPSVVTVSGTASFGDGVTVGSVSIDDYLSTDLTVSSPLELILDQTIIDADPQSSELDLDTAVVEALNSACIHVTFGNRLPLGASVEILLGGDSATLYSSPEIRLGPINVDAGVIGPDGIVIEPTEAQTAFTLDSAQLDILLHDTLWVGERITLHATGGSAVKATATDSLSITGYIEVAFDVNDNLWKD